MVWQKIKIYGELVMFRHTLFALPFAVTGAYLAGGGMWPTVRTFFWILVAMVGARNAANAANRLIDREIDARNPRTSSRHLPLKLVSLQEVLLICIFGFALLVLAAWQLNPLCLFLSPLAIVILVGYSYTKRFTWTTHLVLGLAVGIAPTASWLAVRASFALPPLVLTLIVALWVAGFDIIYAAQDADFDRREKLHAIPARFGVKKALQISAFLHLLSFFLLLSLPAFFPRDAICFNLIYYLGVILTGALLFFEHWLVSPRNLARVKTASYHINEIVSVLILTVTILGTGSP